MPRRALLVLPFALALSASACHSWHAQTGPAPEVVAAQDGRRTLRVTRRDQSVMVLANAQVVGDSIVGTTGSPPQRAAVAVADVQRIDRRGVNAFKTGGLVFGTLLVATAVAVAAAVAAAFGDWS
ncbi:MAG TPA: hypothetical protein VFS20_10400 [Longimicrobium sp.]|nr:hypothetical protein [Longimicrobium sp.]